MPAVFVRAAGDWAEVQDSSSVFGRKTKQIAKEMPRIVSEIWNELNEELDVGELTKDEVVVSFEHTIALTDNHPCIWIIVSPMQNPDLQGVGPVFLLMIKEAIVQFGTTVQFNGQSYTPSMDVELLFSQGCGGSIHEETGTFKATW